MFTRYLVNQSGPKLLTLSIGLCFVVVRLLKGSFQIDGSSTLPVKRISKTSH